MARAIRANGPTRQAPARTVLAPEIVDPRGPAPWEVVQGAGLQGGTNLQGRRMFAPGATDSAQAHAVRLHELLHARITPPDLMARCQSDGRSWEASQACEDCRLNETAHHHELGALLAGAITSEQAETMVDACLDAACQLAAAGALPGGGPNPAQAALHRAACIAVALWRTDQWRAARAAFHANGHGGGRVWSAVNGAIGEIRDNRADPGATIRAARRLDALLEPEKVAGDNDGEADFSDDGKKDVPTSDEAGDLDAQADAVEVLRPPLQRSARHLSRTRRRTTDAGRLTRPTETLRPEGGRPFTRKRRAMGAVILLDSSGSMGYGHETLAEIVEACPGALVAIHASDSEHGARVAIVAEGGRCITAEALAEVRERIGSGNANDAGCLRAVARIADRARIQGPRWWVTDEGFGDVHGSIGHGNVVEHCRSAARWNGFGIAEHESDVFS